MIFVSIFVSFQQRDGYSNVLAKLGNIFKTTAPHIVNLQAWVMLVSEFIWLQNAMQ